MSLDPSHQPVFKPHPLSVAPMMDWTDKHCRYFHRLLSDQALLYTEMVTTGALLYGDQPRHLDFNPQEHPVALQLGGSEPTDLAKAAKLGEQWGYDEINLNCGCPSERVQRGAFGACLMAEPRLVADGVKAMLDVVSVPVTVKHRIGIDRIESYEFVRDFVGTVSMAGCKTFIVHARNAWLQGISPKENRELPPLKPDWVRRLKSDFPQLFFVINGGIVSMAQIHQHLSELDGVMVGREAYHNPWLLTEWDAATGHHTPAKSRDQVEALMVEHMETQALNGVPWFAVSRHMLGLRHGQPGARKWRQVWSDHKLKHLPAREVARLAASALSSDVKSPLS
jgi:tRNA-dihydrouridine synthase A